MCDTDTNITTNTFDYRYTSTWQDAKVTLGSPITVNSSPWVSLDTITTKDEIKTVQEQIDVLKNQMFYVLDEIEKLKSPVHFESLL